MPQTHEGVGKARALAVRKNWSAVLPTALSMVLPIMASACGLNDYDVAPRARGNGDVRPGVPSPTGGEPSMPGPTTGTAGTMPAPTTGVAGTMSEPSMTVGNSGAGAGEAGAGGGGGPAPMRVFDAGSDPSRNQVQAGALCDRLAAIQCAGEAYCCPTVQRDVATCTSALRATCVSDLRLDGISSQGIVGFDAARAAEAFTQLEALASTCDPGIVAFGERLDGLRGMFQGTKAPRESCTPTSLVNTTSAAAALVSCTQPESTACLPSMSGLSWSCAARVGAGDRCFTDVNCQAGMYCDNPELEPAGGPCTARKAVGAACGAPNECQSWFCVGGACVEPSAQHAYCL